MITVATVILVAVALLFAVLVRAGDAPRDEPAPRVKPDEERLAALEESLRDLEFEHRVGKLSEADYREAREEVERERTQLRARAEAGGQPAVAPAREAGATVCPHCGARFATPLKFCGECGRPMRRNSP